MIFKKEKLIQWHVAASVIRGVGYDDVSMGHADVIVDQVNVDPVNGQWSSVFSLAAGPICKLQITTGAKVQECTKLLK